MGCQGGVRCSSQGGGEWGQHSSSQWGEQLILVAPCPAKDLVVRSLLVNRRQHQHLQEGLVTYKYIDDFAAAAKQLTASNDHRYRPKFKQWIVYSMCLRDHGARHRWMGALALPRVDCVVGLTLASQASPVAAPAIQHGCSNCIGLPAATA